MWECSMSSLDMRLAIMGCDTTTDLGGHHVTAGARSSRQQVGRMVSNLGPLENPKSSLAVLLLT